MFNALAGGLGMKGAHHCVMEVENGTISYPEAEFEIEDPSRVAHEVQRIIMREAHLR